MQTVETLIRRRVLRRLIWVCTDCQLRFKGSPDFNGFGTVNLGIDKTILMSSEYSCTTRLCL